MIKTQSRANNVLTPLSTLLGPTTKYDMIDIYGAKPLHAKESNVSYYFSAYTFDPSNLSGPTTLDFWLKRIKEKFGYSFYALPVDSFILVGYTLPYVTLATMLMAAFHSKDVFMISSIEPVLLSTAPPIAMLPDEVNKWKDEQMNNQEVLRQKALIDGDFQG